MEASRLKKPFIIVSDGMDKNIFSDLCAESAFDVHPESQVDGRQLEKLIPKTSAIIIRSKTEITANLLEKALYLKYIIRAGEGTDNIDKLACKQKGIAISNTPGANTHSAAEHAISLMFALLRHIPKAHESMAQGNWDKSLFVGQELACKKIGFVGFGRVGSLVAKKLIGFGPTILFFDPYVDKTPIENARAVDSLIDIFEQSDIISIHLPLVAKTKGIIQDKHIRSMKQTALLINTSRGEVIDEDALCQALVDHAFAGSGLDVFSEEPLASTSALRTLDNVVLTPHLGASTIEAQRRTAMMALDSLRAFFLDNNHINKVEV